MLTRSKSSALIAVFSCLPFFLHAAPVRLTDITLFSTTSDGSFPADYVDLWETRPNENDIVWIQQGESGGSFLTGPTSANAQPNISLLSGANGFRLLGAHSLANNYDYFGINLFFNNSLTPSISAYGLKLTTAGQSHSFAADGASYTPATDWSPNLHAIPGAGTLSCVIGDQRITLTDFFVAIPSVYNLDLVGAFSTGSDGVTDDVAGINLSVTTVPEPGSCTLLVLGLAGYFSLGRASRAAEFFVRKCDKSAEALKAHRPVCNGFAALPEISYRCDSGYLSMHWDHEPRGVRKHGENSAIL
jgi:hypothetical protein